MLKELFAKTPIADRPYAGGSSESSLKRTLTGAQLLLLGIGAVIGAGIFVLTGHAAAEHAGPALVLSFVIAGFACALAGLCYAEFSAMLPISGSAYSYAYATLGESVAWFIGWNLVLEYMFAASTVAVGWSGYLNSLLTTFGMGLPASLSSAPLNVVDGSIVYTGGLFNLPAVAIIAAITGLCYRGITQSALVNAFIVAIKVIVIVLFVAFSIKYINPENWLPFIPENQGPGRYGVDGIIRGASVVFFAYIGFDAVSTAAGEAKNPQRDMPIGILGSLVVCTIICIIVAGVLTGLVPYTALGTPKPVATALETYPALTWLKHIIEIGAIAGLSSVILVMLMGQPRIFYAMAQDGLLPRFFAKVHPTFKTPYVGTVLVGTFAALLAGFLPVGLLGELVSMGTLLAFATVCVGVLVLRRTRPQLARPFRVPAAWLTCPLGAVVCLYLFWKPFSEHWHLMAGWTAIGLLIYAGYGYSHSKLRESDISGSVIKESEPGAGAVRIVPAAVRSSDL
jgi:basic amino acid/polyamine antiporter, APA family